MADATWKVVCHTPTGEPNLAVVCLLAALLFKRAARQIGLKSEHVAELAARHFEVASLIIKKRRQEAATKEGDLN